MPPEPAGWKPAPQPGAAAGLVVLAGGRSSVSCNTGPNSCGPGGTFENSPALQCWVSDGGRTKSRQGRPPQPAADSAVPAGRARLIAAHPALKCWAILSRPSGTARTVRRHCNKLRCAPGGTAAAKGRLALECGDLSPLSRGDLSPSDFGRRGCEMGRPRLAPAGACAPVRTHKQLQRRQVACAKAVTSHRTPKRVGAEICAAGANCGGLKCG